MTQTFTKTIYLGTTEFPFTIEAAPNASSCLFRAWKEVGTLQSEPNARVYNAGASIGDRFVDNHEDAEVLVSGHVKWDGCSNLRFDAQDDCMLHFCGKHEATRLGALLGRLYDIAAELIPGYQGER